MGSQKPLSRKAPTQYRSSRNLKEAEDLRGRGYDIRTSPDYPNNSYYAIEEGVTPHPHEKLVASILAESGFSNILTKEGTVVINGATMPSFDGKIRGLTYEVRETQPHVEKKLASKVADAIQHSRKRSKVVPDYDIQADFAVSVTTNPRVREEHILDGINFHKTRKFQASPKALLQVDGINKKIYVYKVK